MPNLLKKWWVYPGVIGYLAFGVWVGALSYDIHKKPEVYGYAARIAVYPATTFLSQGVLCPSHEARKNGDKSGGCLIHPSDMSPGEFFLFASILNDSNNKRSVLPQEVSPRAVYISFLAFFWPLKAAVNIFFGLAIGVFLAVIIIWGVFMLVLSLLALVVGGFLWLFSLLL